MVYGVPSFVPRDCHGRDGTGTGHFKGTRDLSPEKNGTYKEVPKNLGIRQARRLRHAVKKRRFWKNLKCVARKSENTRQSIARVNGMFSFLACLIPCISLPSEDMSQSLPLLVPPNSLAMHDDEQEEYANAWSPLATAIAFY